MPSLTTIRRVEFHDTDMAGIMHFSAYFLFMEVAEHSLLRSLEVNVAADENEDLLSWPRIAASCEYRAPARFNDELHIEAAVERLGEKSVTYRFIFRCEGREIAVGQMTSVCCRIEPGRPPQPTPIPERVRQALGA